MLHAQPALLTTPRSRLEATHAALRNLLDASSLKSQPLAPLLRSHPAALLATPTQLEATCAALRAHHVQLRRLLASSLQLVTLPTAQVEGVLHFFEHDVGFGHTPSGELVSAYPAVLGHSLDRTLRPLLQYLTTSLRVAPTVPLLWAWADTEAVLRRAEALLCEAGYEKEELRADVTLLAHSYEQRLHPRVTLARRLVGMGELKALPPLAILAAASDADFANSVGCEVEDVKAWRRRGRAHAAALVT